MPKCRNDEAKYYKGTEPSPKGNGWCAHAERIGTRKRGRDGNMWTIKKVNKSKRWVKVTNPRSNKLKPKKSKVKPKNVNHSKVKQPKQPSKHDENHISFRMIIGYYRGTDWDTNEKLEELTVQELTDMIKSRKVWRYFNYTMDYGVYSLDRGTYNKTLEIKPHNIKSVKIQKCPVHRPTLGERIMKKYESWLHYPDKVIIVDFEHVKINHFEVKKPEKILHMDIEFLKWVMYGANHHFRSSDGWITDIPKYKQGSLEVLQISKRKIKVDYRKFGGTNPF